jgi:hypothetical protein
VNEVMADNYVIFACLKSCPFVYTQKKKKKNLRNTENFQKNSFLEEFLLKEKNEIFKIN